MISCQSNLRLSWDTLLFLLLAYIAVVLPYTLAYLEEDDFQRAMNAAWLLPFVAKFLSGLYDGRVLA